MRIEPQAHPILIVDDEADILDIYSRILAREGYPCLTAASGEEALARLEQVECSLALCDINMPGMTGLDLLRIVRDRYPDLVVIMISAVDDRKVAVKALELGALNYVLKPVRRNELLINVHNGLKHRELTIAHRRYSQKLEKLVIERTNRLMESQKALQLAQEETIFRLARAAEFRDNETAQHTLRMSHYCQVLARGYGLDNWRCELIRMASQLHDVGKIAIPDAILLKPGKLTEAEFDAMKRHTEFGRKILDGSSSELLQVGAVIAYTHHEKFDGTGYPEGLRGEAIPLEGRIAAVSDVFDALTSKRVYKEAMPMDQALAILEAEAGRHFDPRLVEIFLDSLAAVEEIKQEFADR